MDWCIGRSPARDPKTLFHAAHLPPVKECLCSPNAKRASSQQNDVHAYRAVDIIVANLSLESYSTIDVDCIHFVLHGFKMLRSVSFISYCSFQLFLILAKLLLLLPIYACETSLKNVSVSTNIAKNLTGGQPVF